VAEKVGTNDVLLTVSKILSRNDHTNGRSDAIYEALRFEGVMRR